ncbi:MAG: hypothetical protein AAF682_15225 [Planctomycetota bacterium]
MTPLRARVLNGRLVIDEPTSLPEGTVLDLVIDDEADDLGPEDREALDQAVQDATSGRLVSAEDVLRRLRQSG